MTEFNLNQSMEEAGKEYGFDMSQNSSDFFKMSEGDNRIRILTPLVVFPQHFNKSGYTGICLGKEVGCPGCVEDDKRTAQNNALPKGSKDRQQMTRNIKWMCWVLDYKDMEIKIAKLPHKVALQLQALQNNPDFSFSEAPLPYDTTINAKGAGTTKVEYMTMPAQIKPLPEDVMKNLEKKNSIEDIKDRMKTKKARELGLIEKEPEGKEIDYPTEESEGINTEDIPW